MSVPRSRAGSVKCPLACHYCRLKKAKCSGERPCGTCVDHNERCTYPEAQKQRRKRKEKDREVEDRLARMEMLLRAATQGLSTEDATMLIQPNNLPPVTPQQSLSRPEATEQSISVANEPVPTDSVIVRSMTTPQQQHQPLPQPPSPSSLLGPRDAMMGASPSQGIPSVIGQGATPYNSVQSVCALPADDDFNAIDGRPTIPEAPMTSQPDMHQAPPVELATPPSTAQEDDIAVMSDRCENEDTIDQIAGASYLSICSDPAAEWVSRQIGSPDFIASARRLSADVVRGERLDRVIGATRTPEPSMDQAIQWTEAYFNGGLDSVFGVLDRRKYLARLRMHFEAGPDASVDQAWYALRNIVYASGCRLALSEDASPAAFAESRSQSWRYYENALSVHNSLIYTKTSLDSVRALLLMAFYGEALGSPGLEYMMLSNAIRLAQAKGLHLGTPVNWNLTSEETASRHWLWWTLYSYDKHLTYRCGRPSAIDDDYISCPIPAMPSHNAEMIDLFRIKTAEHAQISSAISKKLTSARTIHDPPEKLMATVQELENRLETWRQSLPLAYWARPPFKNFSVTHGHELVHTLYLQFSYHVSTIATHGIFCYPWNRADIHGSTNPQIRAQIQESTEKVAEASRQIILGTQRIEITAALPLWLTFYFPLVGLINLFISVLKRPLSPSVPSDLSLMDIVIGHFGYLEFVSSSELVFAFPREIASYARTLVKKARESPEAAMQGPLADSKDMEMSPNSFSNIPFLTEVSEPHSGTMGNRMADPDEKASNMEFDLDSAFVGLDDWRTFLPSYSQGPSFMMSGSASECDLTFLPMNPL